MAIPEDITDLWDEFPLQLKTESLDDLFKTESIPKLTKKLLESSGSLVSYNSRKTKDAVTDSFPKPSPEADRNRLEVVGTEKSLVGGTLNTSKLFAFEDFHSFLAREGGIDQDRLSRLVDDVAPQPNEDFVSFLARSNGIKDEQMVTRLRQALKLEPVLDFQSEVSEVPVKLEQDLDLNVGDGEDAATFFVRAGSWESSSAISEELASVGLDEFVDEDAESFFRRTESTSEYDLDEEYTDGSQYGSVARVTLVPSKGEKDDEVDGIECKS